MSTNLLAVTTVTPQTLLSQQLSTTESALYTVAAATSVELSQGTLCNVSANSVTVLTKGTTSTTGGTLPANAYYWAVTAVSAAGESLVSNQITATTTGTTSEQAMSWTAVSGALTYNVYRGTTSGVYTAQYTGITATTYTDTFATSTPQSSPTASSFGQPITVYLSIVKSGGTVGDGTHRIINAYPLAVNDTLPLTSYITRAMLTAGDALSGYASIGTSVNVVVTGVVSS